MAQASVSRNIGDPASASGDMNKLVADIAELYQGNGNGSPTLTWDAFGNLTTVVNGSETVTITRGIFGQIAGTTGGVKNQTITRDGCGTMTANTEA